jgi:hypothetical protein
MANEPGEPQKPGIGFGDRRANMIGLAALALMLMGFLAGVVFLVVMLVKKD